MHFSQKPRFKRALTSSPSEAIRRYCKKVRQNKARLNRFDVRFHGGVAVVICDYKPSASWLVQLSPNLPPNAQVQSVTYRGKYEGESEEPFIESFKIEEDPNVDYNLNGKNSRAYGDTPIGCGSK